MYRLFYTFLVTWAFVVLGATGEGEPEPEKEGKAPPSLEPGREVCNFDKVEYVKDLDLTKIAGSWYQIRGTTDLPCINDSYSLVIDGTKNTITFPPEVNKVTTELTFTHDKGLLNINDKTTSTSQLAVVLSKNFNPSSTAILYICKVKDSKKIVSARYLSKVKEIKLEDAKKVVDGIGTLTELKWNWTEQYCSSSAQFIPHVLTVIAAVFMSKM